MKRLRELVCLDFLLTNKFKANFTFCMSLIAIAMFVKYPSREREICMYAILISTIADLVLMDYNNIPGIIFQRKRLYIGMALFCITHFLYIFCFFNILPIDILTTNDIKYSVFLYSIIMLATVIFSLCIASKKSSIFKGAAVIYSMIISAALFCMYMCAEVFGGKYILAAVGITMFLISDMFILIRETVCDTTLVRKLIWIFYPIGQLLIILSI